MKAIFMGTPDFAVKSLEKLAENHEVLCVICQPDRPKGRGKKMVFPPVKEKAVELNIPVMQPEKINEKEVIESIKSYGADIIVVAAYGQILSEEILNMPKYGCINVHGSLLPKLRGAAPIQYSIINGDEKTGITIMYMEKGLDSGDMISKAECEISKDDTYDTLTEKLAEIGAELLISTIKDIENGTAIRTPQNQEESTYAHMISRETGHIDWSKTPEEIDCLVRGLSPQPAAYTIYNDEVLKIFKVEVMDKEYAGNFGEIVEITKKGFVVKCKEKSLLVRTLQAKGGKVMDTDAYMRGHKIESGTILK